MYIHTQVSTLSASCRRPSLHPCVHALTFVMASRQRLCPREEAWRGRGNGGGEDARLERGRNAEERREAGGLEAEETP